MVLEQTCTILLNPAILPQLHLLSLPSMETPPTPTANHWPHSDPFCSQREREREKTKVYVGSQIHQGAEGTVQGILSRRA